MEIKKIEKGSFKEVASIFNTYKYSIYRSGIVFLFDDKSQIADVMDLIGEHLQQISQKENENRLAEARIYLEKIVS